MKYAITYDNNFRHIKEVDEIIFNPKDLDGWGEMIEFIYNNISQEQEIIINISEMKQDKECLFPLLKALNSKRTINVQIDFNLNLLDEYISFLKENNIKFMFSNVVKSRNFLKIIIETGASEIYIAGSLLHDLDKISNLKNIYHFKIRTFPNIVFSDAPVDDVECGWIRPEDTEIYEKYIDVFEFKKTPKASLYYEIYKDRKWRGKIYEIIENCNVDIFNDLLPKHFGETRATCHQDCLFEQCQYCNNIVIITKLIEKGIIKYNDKNIIPNE